MVVILCGVHSRSLPLSVCVCGAVCDLHCVAYLVSVVHIIIEFNQFVASSFPEVWTG